AESDSTGTFALDMPADGTVAQLLIMRLWGMIGYIDKGRIVFHHLIKRVKNALHGLPALRRYDLKRDWRLVRVLIMPNSLHLLAVSVNLRNPKTCQSLYGSPIENA